MLKSESLAPYLFLASVMSSASSVLIDLSVVLQRCAENMVLALRAYDPDGLHLLRAWRSCQ